MKRFDSNHRFLLLAALIAFAAATLAPRAQAQNTIRPSTAANGGGASARPATTSGASSSNSSSSGLRQYSDATMMGNAMIQEDTESRSLVIVTDEDTYKEIQKVVQNIDQPKPQVMIKVVFAEVSLNKNLEVGMEGSYTFNVQSPSFTGSSTTTTNSTANSTGGTAVTSTAVASQSNLLSPGTVGTGSLQSIFGLSQLSQGSFVRLATDNWQATLYALAAHGIVNVLSRPTIMARNSQQAEIVVGQEVPFVTSSQITTLGETNNTIQYRDVGIILRVTPFISADKTVEMIVAPEISSVDSQSVQLSANVSSPIIDKRAAETVVVTPDQKTVVIGGMMQKQLTSTIQKIPLLGDLPWLGAAFRHSVKKEQRTELLIFLTPYIIEGTSKMEAITQEEVNRSVLPDHQFSQQDLDNYLDTLKVKQRESPDQKTYPGDPDNIANKLQQENNGSY
jgi:general secretion pathway protein D